MNGIEISQTYFERIVAPRLEGEFPRTYARCTIGLLGKGSDCRAWDDDLSRDHNWGPRIEIILGDSDFQRFGEPIR